MKSPYGNLRLAYKSIAALFAGLVSSSIFAQVSQVPLLNRNIGGVLPNVMLMMDDSGSMSFQHIPEGPIYVGSRPKMTNPIPSDVSLAMVPGDPTRCKISSTKIPCELQLIGTLAATPTSTNASQAMFRSSDVNTIYYNPKVRYLPWATVSSTPETITRYENATPSAAYFEPTNPSKGAYDLTSKRPGESANHLGENICFAKNDHTNIDFIRDTQGKITGYSGCYSSTDTSTFDFDPGLYYVLKKDIAGNYLDPTVFSNYTQYSINTNTSFPKAPGRDDCVSDTITNTCTQAEERQNFANWFTFYRSRNLLLRGAAAETFATQQPDSIRLGWGQINAPRKRVDGYFAESIVQGVRKFDSSAVKSNLYTWLNGLRGEGGTPLRNALFWAGEYYSRKDAKGPWTDFPGGVDGSTSVSNNVNANKSCRRAYTLLVTDGYWDGSTVPVGNADGSNGPLYSSTALEKTYQYIASKPWSDTRSNMLADYAMQYWKTDLNSDMENNVDPTTEDPAFWQHMVTFTVGLGVRGTLIPNISADGESILNSDLNALTNDQKKWGTDQIDDLWHAALNSRGEYISATNPAQLSLAIHNALAVTAQRELKESGVATAQTILTNNNRKYEPTNYAGAWYGDVNAYKLNENAVALATKEWSAEAQLPKPWSVRNIYTWKSSTALSTAGTAVSFTWDTMGIDNQLLMGVGANASIIDFIRGERVNEGKNLRYRTRKGILGDFVNSNPLLVKDSVDMGYAKLGVAFSEGSTYEDFLKRKMKRQALLFAGANDGMLHAFIDTYGEISGVDGREAFAYIPQAVLPNLIKLADPTYGQNQTAANYHQYFVDGPLVEADAYLKGPGAKTESWRNLVLGTLGAGGKAVFAIDVPVPDPLPEENAIPPVPVLDASNVRWEITDAADMGYITAPIATGVLANGKWVAVFGNGSESTNGKAVLFIVDLDSGVASKVIADSGTGNGLGGVGVVRSSTGVITTLYAGDLKGNIWKFNYDANASASGYFSAGVSALFTATDDTGATPAVFQPIIQAPAIFPHSLGGNILVFGTGKLLSASDAASTSHQTIYSVWDKPTESLQLPLNRTNLAGRTLVKTNSINTVDYFSIAGSAVDWTGSNNQRGWRIELDQFAAGMRIIYPIQSIRDVAAFVSAVAPTLTQNLEPCTKPKGSGVNFVLLPESGMDLTTPIFDTNGDNVVNGSDQVGSAYSTLADGRDALLYKPNGDDSSLCFRAMGTVSNTATCISRTIETPVFRERVWRRIINPPIK